MKNYFHRFRLSFLPIVVLSEKDQLYRYQLFISVSFFTALYAAAFLPLSLLMEYHSAIIPIIITIVLNMLFPLMLKRGIQLELLVNIYLVNIAGSMSWLMLTNLGLACPCNPVFLVVLPIIALLCLHRKAAIMWLVIAVLIISAFGISQIAGKQFPSGMNEKYYNLFALVAYCGLVILLFAFIIIFDNAKNAALSSLEEQNRVVIAEKKKSENLLLNILPLEVTEELKRDGKTKAHSFDVATVMFADFINFTSIGENLSPEELVSAIGNYFETFDQIIERYGIEKIKTVGDAYICAAGLPVPSTDNAVIMIGVAREFLQELESLNKIRLMRGDVIFNVRIGINTGPLVAGVVGIKKFSYDIWGDTVNTAFRLQEMGESNRINISGTTHELIKHRFRCIYRGKIMAKNKGEIDMYFVEGKYLGVEEKPVVKG
ncbi:MAG TPA: adenylate/guanylate cyclase domain-containing protein [Chitinophagaceae bacterium]|nr:adenylate/guanylate cyclase domain-containing protein [Chitinophagaceae bacterium]